MNYQGGGTTLETYLIHKREDISVLGTLLIFISYLYGLAVVFETER